MKKQIVVSLTIALMCGLALAQKPDKKKEEKIPKEDKYKPRRIEIASDAAKVRAALIKRELNRRWTLGEDHPDKLIFREPNPNGILGISSSAYMRNIFTLASDGKTTTIYASVEFCVPPYECRMEEHRKPSDPRNYPWNQLDRLLESVKEDAEGK